MSLLIDTLITLVIFGILMFAASKGDVGMIRDAVNGLTLLSCLKILGNLIPFLLIVSLIRHILFPLSRW